MGQGQSGLGGGPPGEQGKDKQVGASAGRLAIAMCSAAVAGAVASPAPRSSRSPGRHGPCRLTRRRCHCAVRSPVMACLFACPSLASSCPKCAGREEEEV